MENDQIPEEMLGQDQSMSERTGPGWKKGPSFDEVCRCLLSMGVRNRKVQGLRWGTEGGGRILKYRENEKADDQDNVSQSKTVLKKVVNIFVSSV